MGLHVLLQVPADLSQGLDLRLGGLVHFTRRRAAGLLQGLFTGLVSLQHVFDLPQRRLDVSEDAGKTCSAEAAGKCSDDQRNCVRVEGTGEKQSAGSSWTKTV